MTIETQLSLVNINQVDRVNAVTMISNFSGSKGFQPTSNDDKSVTPLLN